MTTPLVLYSTITRLAFEIAREYYRDIHYAWCAPVFDAREHSDLHINLPPSSSPYEIYIGLQQDVARRDGHSAKIRQNKDGIRVGAKLKRLAGIITPQQEQDISWIVRAASISDFTPMILVMPYVKVKTLIAFPPVERRAAPLAAELIISALPRRLFDVIRP